MNVIRRIITDLANGIVSDDQTFMEAGIDSLGMTVLQSRLEEIFSLELTATIGFDYPTIGSLATHVTSMLALVELDTHVSIITDVKHVVPRGSMSSSIVSTSPRHSGLSNSFEEFWEWMRLERDLPTLVPLQRWDIEQYYSPQNSPAGTMFVRFASFVDDIDMFDHHLFRQVLQLALRN